MICELVRQGKNGRHHGEQSQGHPQSDRRDHRGGGGAGHRLALLPEGSDEVEDAQHSSFICQEQRRSVRRTGKQRHRSAAARPGCGLRRKLSRRVDVLFVDEAAQMSLANVLAVSQAAKTVVLIGDPQQLDQPMQGSHPGGHGCLGARSYSWRRADHLARQGPVPRTDLAATSRISARSRPSSSMTASSGRETGLEKQVINGTGPVNGSGLRYLPVVAPRQSELLA